MATELCPYCRQRTVVKILQKNVESLSSVQCSGCSRTYQLALEEGEETTMQKAATRETLDSGYNTPSGPSASGERARLGVVLEPNAGGMITSAMSPDEIEATINQRLATAQKGISDPYPRDRARTAEWLQCMKELQQVQRAGASVIPLISDISAEVQALGKDDGAKTAFDLIKDARLSGSRDPRNFVCYR